MKIILVNYRFFISGGPERYLFNVKALLEKEGHTVIPFSVKHKLNLPCKYEDYFISPIGKGDLTYFSESDKASVSQIFKFFSRMFFSFEAKKNFRRLVKDTDPELVYVLHYQNKLSPSFIGVAKKFKLPVIQRVSDFGHICANQLFYNYRLNSVCERCLTGSKLNAVRYRCVYNSALYSLIKITALKFHEFLGIKRKIDAFVIPSSFTSSKLLASGIPESKLFHIPTFYSFSCNEGGGSTGLKVTYGDYALYVGRIEEEKGLMTLVRAFEDTEMPLKIVGYSSNGYDLKIKEYLDGKEHNIEFTGKQSFRRVKDYLRECAFTVCPSECYDNFPNSVIESFAFSKAVVCTNLGSLKEMVENRRTGLLYEPFDYIRLREHCAFLFSNQEESAIMGKAGREMVESKLSEPNHYNSLISVFRKYTENKS